MGDSGHVEIPAAVAQEVARVSVLMVDGLISTEAAATLDGGFSGKVNVGWSAVGWTASPSVAMLPGGDRAAG